MLAVRHMAIMCIFAGLLSGQPAKTTIQDTIYRANGAPFNGTAVIQWTPFLTGDASQIGMQQLTVNIVSGAFYVQLVPNTNATPVNTYKVRYNSDGREQYSETWAVPPSTKALKIADVRTGGATATPPVTPPVTPPAGQTPVLETDVVGLGADLTLRPVKGVGFAPGRVTVTNSAGELEAVAGDPLDCVHVDGTPAPCFGATAFANFVDQEGPGGTVNGVNTTYTLTNAPSPDTSLALYRNGVFQTAGVDYLLNGNTIQFNTPAIPQLGDTLLASYRTGGSAVPSAQTVTPPSGGGGLYRLNTAYPLAGGGLFNADLNISLTDSAFLRRGHKTMVVGDSLAGGDSPDGGFPKVLGEWFGQAAVQSRSLIRYAGNAGVLGDTSAATLARLATDVIAKAPDKVFILSGSTDIFNGVPVAAITTNIAAMVSLLKAANILPILCTLPPRQDYDGYPLPNLNLLNAQIRHLADVQGLPLVDFFGAVVTPADGLFQGVYNVDISNPILVPVNPAVTAAISATAGLFDKNYPWLPASDPDSSNLLKDSLFLQNPSLWTLSTISGGSQPQRSTSTQSTLLGNWLVLNKSDPAAVNAVSGLTITSGFQPGDRLAFTGRIKTSGVSSGQLLYDVGLQFDPGAKSTYPIYHWNNDFFDGQWYLEVTVPPGATSMTPFLQLNTGTGSIYIGQVGVMNLTAMGF